MVEMAAAGAIRKNHTTEMGHIRGQIRLVVAGVTTKTMMVTTLGTESQIQAGTPHHSPVVMEEARRGAAFLAHLVVVVVVVGLLGVVAEMVRMGLPQVGPTGLQQPR